MTKHIPIEEEKELEVSNILLSNSRIGVRSGSGTITLEDVGENIHFDKFYPSKMVKHLPNIIERHQESSVISSKNKELLELLNKEFINDFKLIYRKQTTTSKVDIIKTVLIGTGYGMAMMPIFNNQVYNLDDYGLDIHSSNWLFDVSTVNTMLITSAYAVMITYQYILDENIDHEQNQFPNGYDFWTHDRAKVVFTFLGNCMPILLLWEIELQNQIHDHSNGFDKFVAWASFATIPVIILKTIESRQNYKNYCDDYIDPLDNITSKVILYGVTGLSALGRAVAYTIVTTKTFEKLLPEGVSFGLGITIGGVLSSNSTSLMEYYQMQSLFNKQKAEISKSNIALSFISCLEGFWMASPVILTAIKYTKEWSNFVKYVLFVPLLIVHSTCESLKFYKAFKTKEKELDITDITKIVNQKFHQYFAGTDEILEKNDEILEISYDLIGEATNENA